MHNIVVVVVVVVVVVSLFLTCEWSLVALAFYTEEVLQLP